MGMSKWATNIGFPTRVMLEGARGQQEAIIVGEIEVRQRRSLLELSYKAASQYRRSNCRRNRGSPALRNHLI